MSDPKKPDETPGPTDAEDCPPTEDDEFDLAKTRPSLHELAERAAAEYRRKRAGGSTGKSETDKSDRKEEA